MFVAPGFNRGFDERKRIKAQAGNRLKRLRYLRRNYVPLIRTCENPESAFN